ncbi:MAG: SLC13 family permease [Phycisphaeraceae bacterium]|nr:SLC13 family permease [Phycisphaeraceae bacterium]
MSIELAMVLGLLVTAIVMFAINKPRMDAVAILMLVSLPLTGVITIDEGLRGFADGNIVLIAALFVIGEGLVRTGVARGVGDLLIAKTGKSEVKLLVFLMISVCALGSLMSSTAVTAIFIPIALRVAATSGTSPGRLMMPLSFAALISGMMTLVATAPNLVINSELVRQGEDGFGFFSFTPFGVPILILGIIYMVIARRWLPSSKEEPAPGRVSLADWVQEFELADREYRLRVSSHSALVGKSLGELDMRGTSGANIIAIERMGRFSRTLIQPTPTTRLQFGDVLLIDLFSPTTEIHELADSLGLEPLPLAGAYFNDRSQEIGMAQVIVPAESPLVGKTLVEKGFRSSTGLTVIGLRRASEAVNRDFLNTPLRVGDTLLVVGSWKQIERVRPEETGVLLLKLPIELEEVLPAAGKAPQALFCLGVVVVLMVTGIVANVHAALIGCLLMGVLGCIDLNSSYRSISWKTIVLIVGMLPFSLALQRTGGVDMAADGLLAVTSGAGPHAVLAALFALTAILGMFMSNTATAVLMAPVAIAVAKDMQASPYPFAMIVALAASTAFVTPVSSPVNTLVVTPGNYTFGDFVRIGGPFALIAMIVSVFLVPIVLPLSIAAQ